MPNQLDFSSQLGGSTNNNSGGISSGGFIAVRVVDVNILPNENKKSLFQAAGPGNDSRKYNNLGCIRFQMLNQSTPIEDVSSGNIAFPLNQNIKTLPLINEIVLVIAAPSNKKYTDGDSNALKYYYTSAISVFNSTSVNALPSPQTSGGGTTNTNPRSAIIAGIPNSDKNEKPEAKLGDNFEDKGNIQNLYPQEGDVIFEGRFGQSMRFGSTTRLEDDFSKFPVNPQNPWSSNGENGDPVTIIRNGQQRLSVDFDKWEPLFEDINSDASSIYMTSTQNIPLQIAYSTLTSYGIDVTPPEDTTAEFQKIGEDLGDQFTSNKSSDDMTSVRDSVNVEPDLNTDPNRPRPLFPGIGNNIIQPSSVGDVPSFEFNVDQTAEESQEKENDPNQRPLSFAERRRQFSRRGNDNNRRQSDVPTASERKRNIRNRNQPTGSAVTESFSQRKRRIRGGG